MVHSKLSYGLLAWGDSSIFPRIFRLQRRAVRVVANISYRDDCRQAFINLKILTLPSQYALECLLHIHKNQNMYEMYTNQYNTRCKHNLKLPFNRATKSRDGISYYGPKNKLKPAVRNLPLPQFRTAIRDFLVTVGFFSMDDIMLHISILNL
nr:unnamed protein product [Callosobruchus chinensis]